MSEYKNESSAERPTHTVEDYLMFMHLMVQDDGEIVAARLAELLDVTPATVTMTLKRMERDQWIVNRGRGDITLTETGQAAANSVTRRHMLVECMLVDLLKVPINETHVEAHAIEHAISPALEERLGKVLGDPKLCPHGNPFPGHEALVSDWLPLTEFQEGQQVIIRRIHMFAEEKPALIQFLYDHGIIPGVRGEIVDVLSFNQTLRFRLENEVVTLGNQTAQWIFGELLEPEK